MTLRTYRNHLAQRYFKRRLSGLHCTVISDDCWAGRLYSQLRLKCNSPFIGMGVDGIEYLDLIVKLHEPGALDILSVSNAEFGYPVIQTRHAKLHGLHYGTNDEFRDCFERRRDIICWDNLFIKIDLGKPIYRRQHIAHWNRLRLPHSVALYPDTPYYRSLNIHHGVAVKHWNIDGDSQFHLSSRHFDVAAWLLHDRLACSWVYRLFHFAILDPAPLARLFNLLRPTLPHSPRPSIV
jgi:uncharacterized protein (DUF1919 family)